MKNFNTLYLISMVNRDENILWAGKPNKLCFLLETIFNPFLFLAGLWLAIDSTIIYGIATSKEGFNLALILFMLVHLLPVWLYLGSVLLFWIKYKNTEYVVTDKNIYISGGYLTRKNEVILYDSLSHISAERGLFDLIFGVGDVVLHSKYGYGTKHGTSRNYIYKISDISEYKGVCGICKNIFETNLNNNTQIQEQIRQKKTKERKNNTLDF